MPEGERITETDSVYARLRQAVLGGQLLPGQRLIEADLARDLGAGRAAVRTALARLEQDGLFEREPFRGSRVRVLSPAEAVEIIEARAALEGLAARYAARNASADDVAALRAILEQMRLRLDRGDLLGVSELNGELHRQLLRIARHQTAARLIDQLQAQLIRYQFRTVLVPGRAERSLGEHQAIVDRIAAHDGEGAETAIRQHLSHVVDALRQVGTSNLAELALD